MENIQLLILEDDREYAQALAGQLVLKYRDFRVTAVDSLRLGGEKLEDYELLLIGDITAEAKKEQEAEFQRMESRCVFLKRTPDPIRDWEVSRCGRISELAAGLLLTYGKVSGKNSEALDLTETTRITGFISGAGGTGKTAAAIVFSRILAREKNKKTLYLCFEEFDSQAYYMETPREKKLDDFLYYLFSKEEKRAATYLEAFLFCDRCGVFTLFPSEGRNELLSLSEEELSHFFKILLRYGEFDHLVLDLPVSFGGRIRKLIERCEALVIVTDRRAHSQAKSVRLEAWLKEPMGFTEDQLFPVLTEWDEENFIRREVGEELDIHHQLGREMRAIAEQRDQNGE